MNLTENDVVQKQPERDRLAADVAEFLRRGGVIEQIDGPRARPVTPGQTWPPPDQPEDVPPG